LSSSKQAFNLVGKDTIKLAFVTKWQFSFLCFYDVTEHTTWA